jgi:hypothetical protein
VHPLPPLFYDHNLRATTLLSKSLVGTGFKYVVIRWIKTIHLDVYTCAVPSHKESKDLTDFSEHVPT